jgi:hypothetical protein
MSGLGGADIIHSSIHLIIVFLLNNTTHYHSYQPRQLIRASHIRHPLTSRSQTSIVIK